MPKIFGDDNCEVYECVEIQLNIYIFILEFTVVVGGGCEVGRLMFNQPFPVNKRQSGVSRSSSTGGPFSNQNVANLQSLFASTSLQYAHGAWWRAP